MSTLYKKSDDTRLLKHTDYEYIVFYWNLLQLYTNIKKWPSMYCQSTVPEPCHANNGEKINIEEVSK